ncbi:MULTISPECIES: GntR family transcriptional regulator [Streptomyces]|uniref:GntR family transcriptional regulator n=1 Tax=Streptomyces TaxID=1883 RepID=UPI00292E10BD|nr:GntR family transcriptional regulator [Streptomyces sasae]
MPSPDAQTTRLSKSQLVYRALRERIMDGTYSPGYRLVLEQLAREFSVSAVPVREAVRLLEAEGHVTFERNVGARVAIDETKYETAAEALAVVDGAAVGLSGPLLTEDDLEAAREVNEKMRRSRESFDPVGFARLNGEFHAILRSRCPNTDLLNMVDRQLQLLDRIRRSPFDFVPARSLQSVEEHEELLALIERGTEPDKVERYARQHRLNTLQAFIEQRRQSAE